jgi:hypothetical protein
MSEDECTASPDRVNIGTLTQASSLKQIGVKLLFTVTVARLGQCHFHH